MQFVLREMQNFARSLHFWIVFSALVLLFTAIGPFGTAQTMAVGPRFGFWLVTFAGTTAIAILCVVISNMLFEGLIGKAFPRMLIGALFSSLPIGFFIMVLVYSWRNVEMSWQEYFSDVADALPLATVFPLIYWAAMRHEKTVRNFVEVQTEIGNAAAENHTPPPAAPLSHQQEAPALSRQEPPPLLSRLKPETRATILRLSAEDHYTRVQTSRGEELLLIRFSDALQELGDTEGTRIHRSHWIAKAGVKRLEQIDGKLQAIMRDGTALPVSRSFGPTVRETIARWQQP